MNVSATLNAFRLIFNPTQLLPQATIQNFNQLPVPVSHAFPKNAKGEHPDIRAIVLDKDNCFAVPKENVVYKEYEIKFTSLRSAYPHSLLIVSNSSGTSSSDPDLRHAALLEKSTGVPVLAHKTKKPGCGAEVMAWFRARPESGVTHPSQVAVVGDRLSTDVVMANSSGMWSVWIRDGVVEPKGLEGFFTRAEKGLERWMKGKGWEAPVPEAASPFE